MKLIIAIVQDNDSSRLVTALNESHFSSTKLASTGGFLKQGNTTIMVGCQEEKVEEVLDIIKNNCSESRMDGLNIDTARASVNLYSMSPIKIKGATVFVVPIESFHRF